MKSARNACDCIHSARDAIAVERFDPSGVRSVTFPEHYCRGDFARCGMRPLAFVVLTALLDGLLRPAADLVAVVEGWA